MNPGIYRFVITVKREEYDVKSLYAAKSEARNKRQVREDGADLCEIVAKGLRAGRKPDTDGGQSGFWKDGRVEEIVINRGGETV